MGKIIAFINQKGGVGKSTITMNMASYLTSKGKSVLTIDLDPQGNATSNFGFSKEAKYNSIYQAMSGENNVNDCIYK